MGADGGAGGVEAGIMGCWRGEAGVCPHHGIVIWRPLGHLPLCFLLLIYLIRNCMRTVMMKPKNMSSSSDEPSICALQLKFRSPVLLVDSLCLIMSPKTELLLAPWMSRGHIRGMVEFCWQCTTCALGPHMISKVITLCT